MFVFCVDPWLLIYGLDNYFQLKLIVLSEMQRIKILNIGNYFVNGCVIILCLRVRSRKIYYYHVERSGAVVRAPNSQPWEHGLESYAILSHLRHVRSLYVAPVHAAVDGCLCTNSNRVIIAEWLHYGRRRRGGVRANMSPRVWRVKRLIRHWGVDNAPYNKFILLYIFHIV